MHQKSLLSYFFRFSFGAAFWMWQLILASQECLQLCTAQEAEEISIVHVLTGNVKESSGPDEHIHLSKLLNSTVLAIAESPYWSD